ncbi:MAG: hypothetical protein WBA46_02545 [Thermomicrobiales bacterium]
MKIHSTVSMRLASSVLSVAVIASMMLGAFAGIAAFPSVAAAQDANGLVDDTTYVSPQYGYTVTWGDPWSTRARNVTSTAEGIDTLTLRDGSSSLRITGRAAGDDLATVLDDTIAEETDNIASATVDQQDATADPATATLTVNSNTVQIEVHEDTSADAIIVIVLTARTASFDSVLADTQDVVLIDDSPIMVGEPLGSGSSSRSSRTSRDETATPEDTKTSDSGSKTIATEETATDTPEATATETSGSSRVSDTPPVASGVDGSTYTSPNFGYTFEWDDRTWTLSSDSEVSQTDPVFDSLYLQADTGNLYIYGYDGYDGDPAACLQGESDYFQNEGKGVADWTMANNANGDPLTNEDATSAWGVFNLTYTNPDDANANPRELTDYIECRTLVPGQSILIIFASAPRSAYNDHIDVVQAVIDTIQIPEASPEPTKEATKRPTREATKEATETVAATETADVTETTAPDVTKEATKAASGQVDGLEGSVFTSPSFGFVFTIPAEFSLQEATVDPGDESLTLTNGVSVITVHATDNADYTGSLTSCVEAVAATEGADRERFRLDRTADGSAFQGSDDRSAYANYTFTGSDGSKYAFFIECRAITEGESALIVTQVVPYEQYTTERAARREIQNSIEMP